MEKAEISPNATHIPFFKSLEQPWSHSFAATVIWSTLIAIAATRSRSLRVGAAMGLAVGSHWLLDLIVHVKDLPIEWGDSPRLGFGLWNHVGTALALETGIVLAAVWLYMRGTHPIRAGVGAAGGVWIFAVVMLLINAANSIVKPPIGSMTGIGLMALASYIVFAIIAGRLERCREPCPATRGAAASATSDR